MLEVRNSCTFQGIFLYLITAAICLFLMQPVAFAAEKVDQSNLPEWAGGWTHINPDPNGQARMWQTFTPDYSNITAVEIDILTVNIPQLDDIITIEIAKNGEILTSTERNVEYGFDGLLRFEFDKVVPVIPGELYELKVHDTGLTRFGWKYASNTYDAGTRYVSANERPGTDWFFQTYSLEPHIIYVDDDAPGANDGSSWENAYVYLQDALADANDENKPVEIRVAQGIYRPDLGGSNVPGDREAAFKLINGVTLAGGYAGIDTNDPNARDIGLYETILTGDLNGDDVELSIKEPGWFTTRAENSYNVLIGSGTDMTAVLDGFIITGGAANGPELDGDTYYNKYRLQSGGGMYNCEGSPTLTNCTFSRNAGLVGGMYNYISNVTMTNCTFSDNSGWTAGGMMNQESSVTLTNCTFNRNSDGAIQNFESSIILANCTFSENLRTISFRSNYGLSIPTLTNCIFSGNYGPGGVISYYNWDDPNSGPVSILTNCTFSGNYGGMISYHYWDDPNSVAGPILTNCILWYNTPNEIPQNSTVTYSNIQGGWEGQGNIDEEPLFANPGYYADVNDPNIVVTPNDPNIVWVDGDYHLKSQRGRWDSVSKSWIIDDVTSTCIDAGDPNSPVGDEPEPNGGRINMGAYGGTSEASKSYTLELFQTAQELIRDFRFKAVK
jgi:hypothetical protein